MTMVENQTNRSDIILPHSNKLALSIVCTLFCCLIGGIIAIIYSSKSNNLYNSAILAEDESMKMILYTQSEASNKTAQTWITISLVCGAINAIATFILGITGALADLL